MDKDTWIAEKIKKILSEGVNGKPVSQEQAAAIANSMWEEEHGEVELAKRIRMPILPASATRTVDKREVPQKLINDILEYDASVRQAIVKLDSRDAHGNSNGPALGRVERVYREGAFIYADVTPQRGAELTLAEMCSIDGPYPCRSIEADKVIPDQPDKYWLESISLCGAQRPALNLPPVEFSAGGFQKLVFSLIGEEKIMENTAKPDTSEKVDLAKLKAELEESYAKKLAQQEADFSRKLAEEKAARLAIEARQEIKDFFATQLARKVPSTEREDLINLAMALPDGDERVAFAKNQMTPRRAFLASLENRKETVPDLKVVAGGTGNEMQEQESDPEKVKMAKIEEAGKANGWDTKTLEGYDRAYTAALRANPDIFAKRQGVV